MITSSSMVYDTMIFADMFTTASVDSCKRLRCEKVVLIAETQELCDIRFPMTSATCGAASPESKK